MRFQSLVLGSATSTVVLVGVTIVILVMFFPLFVVSFARRPMTRELSAVIIVLQALHLYFLWTCTFYLSICRQLLLPIRKPIMIIVFQIARIEAIREEEATMYLDMSTIKQSEDGNATNDILQSFKSSVRRRYTQMEDLYRQHNIRCLSVLSEEALNLSKVVPIMIEHERRCCQADGKNLVEEFIKRFLVVTMTTDAVLDLYYNQDD